MGFELIPIRFKTFQNWSTRSLNPTWILNTVSLVSNFPLLSQTCIFTFFSFSDSILSIDPSSHQISLSFSLSLFLSLPLSLNNIATVVNPKPKKKKKTQTNKTKTIVFSTTKTLAIKKPIKLVKPLWTTTLEPIPNTTHLQISTQQKTKPNTPNDKPTVLLSYTITTTTSSRLNPIDFLKY